MSVCEDVKERMCEFLDGELKHADRSVVESHIQGCSACREELAALRQASSAVQALERRAAPAAILAGVRAGLKEAPRTEPDVVRPEPSFWWRRAISVAAVLIVATLIYLAYSPPQPDRQATAPNRSAERKAPMAKTVARPEAAAVAPAAVESKTFKGAMNAADEIAPKEESLDMQILADSTARRDRSRATSGMALEAPAEPQAPPAATSPVGTPPNIMEGEKKGLTRQPVLQQWKEDLGDLAEQYKRKADGREVDEKQLPAPEERAKMAEQAVLAEVQGPREPATQAPAKPAAAPSPNALTKVATAVQQDDHARQEGSQKPLPEPDMAEDVAQTADTRNAAFKDAMKSRAQTESKASGDTGAGSALTQNKDADLETADQPTASVGRRQVLTVPQQDVGRVMQDLKRLAEASGGELAWLPAGSRRSMKKEVQQQARVAQQAVPISDRVVIHVPRERMDEMLRAAAQYQAQRVLDREAGGEKTQVQQVAEAERPDRKLSVEPNVAGKAPAEQYVQLVVEILPQAMAEASQVERVPAAKAKVEQAK